MGIMISGLYAMLMNLIIFVKIFYEANYETDTGIIFTI